jgi:hypothetical protein
MTVRLENIDELRRRTNVSYEAAKEALEKCNDDLVEAIVYLEKQNMVKPSTAPKNKTSLWTKFKKLVGKGNRTRFIIHKKENTILNIPVTLAVIIAVMAPHLTLIGLIVGLITGFRIKLEGKYINCSEINGMLNKVSDTVDSAKQKLLEESKSTAGTN